MKFQRFLDKFDLFWKFPDVDLVTDSWWNQEMSSLLGVKYDKQTDLIIGQQFVLLYLKPAKLEPL